MLLMRRRRNFETCDGVVQFRAGFLAAVLLNRRFAGLVALGCHSHDGKLLWIAAAQREQPRNVPNITSIIWVFIGSLRPVFVALSLGRIFQLLPIFIPVVRATIDKIGVAYHGALGRNGDQVVRAASVVAIELPAAGTSAMVLAGGEFPPAMASDNRIAFIYLERRKGNVFRQDQNMNEHADRNLSGAGLLAIPLLFHFYARRFHDMHRDIGHRTVLRLRQDL